VPQHDPRDQEIQTQARNMILPSSLIAADVGRRPLDVCALLSLAKLYAPACSIMFRT
jgi:hypothetical protein